MRYPLIRSVARNLCDPMLAGRLWLLLVVVVAGSCSGCGPGGTSSTSATSPTGATGRSDDAAGEDEEQVAVVLKTEPGPGIWDPKGLPDFAFTERDGRTVSKRDLLGKPWIAGFIFTRCAGPCPLVTGAMKQIEKDCKEADFRLVTFTVDPARDTLDVLNQYADGYDAPKERWLFLTGEQRPIYELIRDGFKLPVEETTGPDRKPGFEIIHSTAVVLVNAEGVCVAKFNATKDDEVVRLRRIIQGKAPMPKVVAPEAAK